MECIDESYFNNLNEYQKKAVFTKNKYVLVIASAGTGKTRVLVGRYLYLLKEVNYNQIIALTFTNKAAKEMINRIDIKGSLFVGTFHSICLRLLREYANISPTIIDDDDMKKILEKLEYSENLVTSIKHIQDNYISIDDINDKNHISIKEAYIKYNKELEKNNLMDFNTIILKTIDILKNPSIGDKIRERFKYVLVDEYQDTSTSQENLLIELTKEKTSLFAVGDDDQSIYHWRGANIQNILTFQDRYPNSEIIELQNNYRSTNEILDFAKAVINSNDDRYKKQISGIKNGNKVQIYSVPTNRQEPAIIASQIQEIILKGNYSYKDIGILARSNQTLRFIEQELNINSIPYRLFSGIKFFDRQEIKTIISYFRLILNNNDWLAFEKVISSPRRGIGLKTLEILKKKEYLFENLEGILSKKQQEEMEKLENLLFKWKKDLKIMDLSSFLFRVLEESGLKDFFKEKHQINNLKELSVVLSTFKNLQEFIDTFYFIIDEKENNSNYVSLMTLHMAKGLEFPIVILPAWSEGYLPHPKSVEEGNISEETRLAYVGVTRAKDHLYIYFYNNNPSRFLRKCAPYADIFMYNN
ncbi:hypothetical protein AB836_01435 [Rickettsiales bacterium (ex Bugula neritina AB1)]|nr:hypothetical protein AB836_01435 [Rickettsiales bacterium (ex Bugula neritina AB1)]